MIILKAKPQFYNYTKTPDRNLIFFSYALALVTVTVLSLIVSFRLFCDNYVH